MRYIQKLSCLATDLTIHIRRVFIFWQFSLKLRLFLDGPWDMLSHSGTRRTVSWLNSISIQKHLIWVDLQVIEVVPEVICWVFSPHFYSLNGRLLLYLWFMRCLVFVVISMHQVTFPHVDPFTSLRVKISLEIPCVHLLLFPLLLNLNELKFSFPLFFILSLFLLFF
jgi:hypothetical protein